MKNDNLYKLTWFEKLCLFSIKVLNFFIFIFCFQYIFSYKSGNIIISIICLLICVLYFGWYLANNKISQKIGSLIESNKRLNNIASKYIDTAIVKDNNSTK